MAKKRRRTRRVHRSTRAGVSPSKNFRLVFKNMIIFAALALACFLLFKFLKNELFQNLFYLLMIIFAFLAVAFLLVLLIFFVLKLIKKRR